MFDIISTIGVFIECCGEISIDFNKEEFNEHHNSPLVGRYHMTGMDVKNNYEYKHQPGTYRFFRQTDWNWKVDMLILVSDSNFV